MDNYPTIAVYTARMTKIIIGLSFVIAVGGAVYFRSAQALVFAVGVLAAAVSNVVKVFWLKHSVNRAMQMDNPAYGATYVRGQGMLRMFFTLAVLVGAGFLSQNDTFGFPILVGAILGLLTMPVSAYAMGFFARRDYKNTPPDTNTPRDTPPPEGDNTHAV